MRKAFGTLLVLALLGVIAFFRLGPALIESNMNRIDGKPLLDRKSVV